MYKYYYEQITACDNDNLQFHDQEESKLNSTINVKSVAHRLTQDKIIKSPFNRKNLATSSTMVPMYCS